MDPKSSKTESKKMTEKYRRQSFSTLYKPTKFKFKESAVVWAQS